MRHRTKLVGSALFVAIGLVTWTGTAQSETLISKSFSYYSIGGKTADDLDRELARRGPLLKSSGTRHPGATEMKFGGDVEYVQKGNRCAVSNVQVKLSTKLILPRWRNRKRADPDLALIWDTLARDIKRHEERHAEIARNHARILEKKLVKLWPRRTCAEMEKSVAKETAKIMAAHDADQARFDRVEAINFESRMVRLLKYRLEQIQK